MQQANQARPNISEPTGQPVTNHHYAPTIGVQTFKIATIGSGIAPKPSEPSIVKPVPHIPLNTMPTMNISRAKVESPALNANLEPVSPQKKIVWNIQD